MPLFDQKSHLLEKFFCYFEVGTYALDPEHSLNYYSINKTVYIGYQNGAFFLDFVGSTKNHRN